MYTQGKTIFSSIKSMNDDNLKQNPTNFLSLTSLRACLNFKFKLQTPYFDYNFTFFHSNSKGYYYEKESKFYPKISRFRQNR